MDSSSTSSVDELSPYQQPSQSGHRQHANSHRLDTTGRPITARTDSRRSPSAIALRAFLLGLTFGVSLTLTFLAVQTPPNPLWRASFFLATLSTFHFLEFYITARYNPPAATVGAFLLSQNATPTTSHILWPLSSASFGPMSHHGTS